MSIMGRLLPHFEIHPSLMAPATGCTKMAIISPNIFIRPSHVFFTDSDTSPSIITGMTIAFRLFHIKDIPNQYAFIKNTWNLSTIFIHPSFTIRILK